MVLYDPKKRKIVEMQSVQNAFLSAGNFLQDADEIVKKVEEMLKKWESFSLTPWGFPVRCTELSMSAIPQGCVPLYTWKNPWGTALLKMGKVLPVPYGENRISLIYRIWYSHPFLSSDNGDISGTLSDLWILGLSGHETDWR